MVKTILEYNNIEVSSRCTSASDVTLSFSCPASVSEAVLEQLENIGMDCGLMPITGIPLPFMSYGSSFMVVNFVMLGMIGSVFLEVSLSQKKRLGRRLVKVYII